MKKRVLVAMSGGVDSSTVAAILKNEGHEVMGLTMSLFPLDWEKSKNKAATDLPPSVSAARVAKTLGIPHQTIDLALFFEEAVIHPFISEYQMGRTPNPCVRCNAKLKFGLLLDKAAELGYDALATGHYAQIIGHRLYQGADSNKDQSYFLYTLQRHQMERLLFPLGKMTKAETRLMAGRFNLPVQERKESQDICFMDKGAYRTFLEKRGIVSIPGFIVDTAGNILGEHHGLHHFTIGQRKGIGALGRACFVVRLDGKSNTVVVGDKSDLLVPALIADQLTFCSEPLRPGDTVNVQLRYRGQHRPAILEKIEGTSVTLRFAEPAEGVAPGQSAVFYRENEVVGGSVIRKGIN